MAYTPVPNAATGDKFTAAYVNAYLRDNFAAGVPDIFTAKGQLAAATAADVAAPVTAPTANGQVLTADSTASTGMAWKMPPDSQVIDAKGDLIVGSAADTMARLAVGTSDQILMADSTATNGLRWVGRSERWSGSTSAEVDLKTDETPLTGWTAITPTTEQFDRYSDVTLAQYVSIPRSGYYVVRFSGVIRDTAAAFLAGDFAALGLYVGISTLTAILDVGYARGTSTYIGMSGSTILYLAQSESLYFKVYYSVTASNTRLKFQPHNLQIAAIY